MSCLGATLARMQVVEAAMCVHSSYRKGPGHCKQTLKEFRDLDQCVANLASVADEDQPLAQCSFLEAIRLEVQLTRLFLHQQPEGLLAQESANGAIVALVSRGECVELHRIIRRA